MHPAVWPQQKWAECIALKVWWDL